jgi:hypothetical protein
MPVRAHVCFAAGKALSRDDAIFFGNFFAEPPIILDYLSLTEGNPLGDKERDWWDEGPINERIKNYLNILIKRHRIGDKKQAALRGTPMPDILTYQGLNRDQLQLIAAKQVTSRSVGVPQLLVMSPAKGNRHEFYEIKPRSISGIAYGELKVTRLKQIYPENGLPYVGGTLYPDFFHQGGIAKLPLLAYSKGQVSLWGRELTIVKSREKLSSVDLYLEVRRLGEGLLLYRVCVELQMKEDKSDTAVFRIARDLVHTFVTCTTADKSDEVIATAKRAWAAMDPMSIQRNDEPASSVLPGTTLYQPRFAGVVATFADALSVIKPMIPAIQDSLNSRCLGLPGEEYLVCCDEEFFASLSMDAAPLLNMMNYIRQTPVRWIGYLEKRGSLGALDVVAEAKDIYAQAQALGIAGFKALIDWAKNNPAQAVALVVLIVATSALLVWALPLVLLELELGAVGAEAVTLTAQTSVRIAVTEVTTEQVLAARVRVALTDTVMEELAENEAVEQGLQRGAAQSLARPLAQATGIPRVGSAASTAERALRNQAVTPGALAAAQSFLKSSANNVVPGVPGINVAVSVRSAFAQPDKTSGASSNFSSPIGTQIARMFLSRRSPQPPPIPGVNAGALPPAPVLPPLGGQFDVARFSKDAAASLKPGGPTKAMCRYLGRLTLS